MEPTQIKMQKTVFGLNVFGSLFYWENGHFSPWLYTSLSQRSL